MSEFYVGDTVKVLDNKYNGDYLHDVGTIGTVVDVDCENSIGVEANGITYWYLKNQLEKGHMKWVKD